MASAHHRTCTGQDSRRGGCSSRGPASAAAVRSASHSFLAFSISPSVVIRFSCAVADRIKAVRLAVSTPPSEQLLQLRTDALSLAAKQAKDLYEKGSGNTARPFKGFNIPVGSLLAWLGFAGRFPPWQVCVPFCTVHVYASFVFFLFCFISSVIGCRSSPQWCRCRLSRGRRLGPLHSCCHPPHGARGQEHR
jgi:hypothetical protein